jgi:S-(hydroxymethyl)glutathione dehydrogenase/alcohol dehydrogenase
MKAAILERLGAPLVVDDIGLPALGVGQVLVRVYAAGICGAQLNEIAGNKGPDRYLPHLLGHEGGGIVEEIGVGVTRVKPGDHVVLHWRRGAGIESACPKYTRGDALIGGGWVTTFQEYSVVSENRLTVIDESTDDDVAALMGCAVTTGMGVVFNEARLQPGQSIAIIGCGGVGLSIIQAAALASAGVITGLDTYPTKLKLAAECGATQTIDLGESWLGLKYITSYDVIVDTTGKPDLVAEAYRLVAPGGMVIMVGQPKRGDALVFPDAAGNFRGKVLMDSTGGHTSPNEDIPRYLILYRKGLLRVEQLITHHFPLDRVNEALDTVRSGCAGRVILEME